MHTFSLHEYSAMLSDLLVSALCKDTQSSTAHEDTH